MKDTDSTQMEEMWEEVWSVVPSLGVPLSLRLHMCTSLEALPAPYFWDFMEASSSRPDPSLTPV